MSKELTPQQQAQIDSVKMRIIPLDPKDEKSRDWLEAELLREGWAIAAVKAALRDVESRDNV